MSQQKPKKSCSPWLQCDKCLVNILNRDIEKHSNDCPPNIETLNYNLIKDEILYGTIDIKTNEDIKGVTNRENLVFLSQSAIQLCCLAIGEWAVICSKNTPPIPKIVWPTIEKSLTSVLLTKNALDVIGIEPNCFVTVQRINGDLIDAQNIRIVILNRPKSMEITSDLINRLQKNSIDNLFCVGNRFSLMYFGKLLRFEIKTITSDSIENDLNNLSLKQQFYKATDRTVWKLYSNEDEFVGDNKTANLLEKIGGLDREITEITEAINICINPSITYGIKYSKSLLLYGHSGTGKTLLVNAIPQQFQVNTINISSSDLYNRSSDQNPEEILKNLYETAEEPTILIIDEIDSLCPIKKTTDTERRVITALLNIFDDLNQTTNRRIFILATTNKPDLIDPIFRRCGRLDREIEIPTPNPPGRRAILSKLFSNITLDLNEHQINDIVASTHGFVGADLVSLLSRAGLYALRQQKPSIQHDDFKLALNDIHPSAMRQVQVEVANVKWSDIGGENHLKKILQQTVEWPQKYPESFQRLGVQPPKGVLLYGPPGCSKTMIAKAVATETGLNFLSIKGPELFNKWVGESERGVREIFRKARQVAPSIVFFDEIDALAGERSTNTSSSSNVQERVLAQLLTELDGVSPLNNVTIIAATNRPDRIDKALLRPGRLDRIVYVPLPDDLTRREILRLRFTKMPISDDVNVDEIVAKTDGYSGAEVTAICQEAAMMALDEDIEARIVQRQHFETALKLITPRTPKSLIKLYEDYLNQQKY